MLYNLLATSNDWTLTLLRLTMGVVFFARLKRGIIKLDTPER